MAIYRIYPQGDGSYDVVTQFGAKGAQQVTRHEAGVKAAELPAACGRLAALNMAHRKRLLSIQDDPGEPEVTQ